MDLGGGSPASSAVSCSGTLVMIRRAATSLVDRFPNEDLTVIVLTNNTGLTASTATLTIGGRPTTFPANAAREVVERVENLYFTGRISY